MKRVLIFLDIDGVLNRHEIDERTNSCPILRELVDNLNELLDRVPHAQIIVSSAWRYMVLKAAMTVQGLEYLLVSHGLHCVDRVIGVTQKDPRVTLDNDEFVQMRTEQIFHELERIPHDVYLVIDDLDMRKVFGERQIVTHPHKGITREQAEYASTLC